MKTVCPVCKSQDAEEKRVDLNKINYQCIKCGIFQLDNDVNNNIKNSVEPYQKISSWISEQNKIYHEYMPYIDLEKLDSISNQRDKTIREKFDRMIIVLSGLEKLNIQSKWIKFENLNECYIENQNELSSLIQKARDMNLIKINASTSNLLERFTFEGKEYLESLNTPNQNSNKIFMAFWFDHDIQKIFDNIVKPAIDEAGFLAERVSSSTTNLENKISDEIIGMIKSSRALIADCTGNRTAVYYEAGYAMGMKIPVIWTCREDQVGDVCFDVSQHPFILWNSPEDLADKIVKRLNAIL